MDERKLGEKIRNLRRRMKLTQSELAGPEFTKSFISQVEKGQTRPSLKSLQIIAARLNQPVSYFLEERDPVAPHRQEVLSLIETASNLHTSGLLNEAISAYQRALSMCEATDHSTKGNLYYRLGHIYLQLKQYNKAVDALTLSVTEYKQTSVDEYFVRALNNLGTSYFLLGQLSEARRWFDEALTQHDRLSIPNAQLRLSVLSNLANVLSRLALYEEAIRVVEAAILFSKDEGEYFKYGELSQIAGVVFDAVGNNTEALRFTDQAITFYEAVGNRMLLIMSELNKAIHLRKLGRLDEAKKLTRAVLGKTRHPDLVPERARACGELAAILSMQGEFNGVLKYVKEALRLAPSHHDVPEWVSLIVECAKHAELPQEFLDRLEQLVDRWEGEPRGKAELHSSLGELYRLAGSTSKANDHLAKSVAYFKQS